MKAMILAAGLGTRLLPLTKEKPKPLFPILGKPILETLLELLKKNGVDEVVINLHHLPGPIEQRLGNGKKWGLRIHYSFEPQILGSGGGLKKMEGFFKEAAFFLINGDVLIDVDLKKVLSFHRAKKGMATMVLRPDKNVEQYGAIAIDSQNRIRQFLGVPQYRGRPLQKLMFTGVHVLEPDIFNFIPEGVFSNINRVTYPKLLDERPVFGYPFRGFWRECGEPSGYFALNMEKLKKGSSRKPKKTPQCRFVPPVWVGEGCRFGKKSVVGPWAILGDQCHIGSGARVSHAILWDESQVSAEETIDHAIVGKKEKVNLLYAAISKAS